MRSKKRSLLGSMSGRICGMWCVARRVFVARGRRRLNPLRRVVSLRLRRDAARHARRAGLGGAPPRSRRRKARHHRSLNAVVEESMRKIAASVWLTMASISFNCGAQALGLGFEVGEPRRQTRTRRARLSQVLFKRARGDFRQASMFQVESVASRLSSTAQCFTFVFSFEDERRNRAERVRVLRRAQRVERRGGGLGVDVARDARAFERADSSASRMKHARECSP